MNVDVLPGDMVETLGGQKGLIVSVDADGYALVLGSAIRLRTFYGGNLKILARMPEEAGRALEAAFRLGGVEALNALRDGDLNGEPRETLRMLLVEEIMTR